MISLHPMRSSSFPTLFALLLCFLPILALSADQELAPPFRLHWGESAIHLEEALLGTTAKIVERQTLPDSREVWKVQGLPGIALQQVNFYLHKSKLVEVELQYWKDDWSPQTYEEFMQNVRQGLEEKFQAGKPLTRQQSTEHGVARALLGFRWEIGPSAIELFYFAAQDPKNVFRSISLHYKSPNATPPPNPPKNPPAQPDSPRPSSPSPNDSLFPPKS